MPQSSSRRTSRGRTARAAACAALLAVGVSAAVQAATQGAGATPVPVYWEPTYLGAATGVDGLTMDGSGAAATLYEWSSCGGEFAPATSQTQGLQTGLSTPVPVPAGTSQLLDPPAATCDGEQPVGERAVIYNNRLWWPDRNGWILGQPLTGSAFSAYQMAAPPPLLGGGHAPGIVVDDAAVTWTETSGGHGVVYDARASVPGRDYSSTRQRDFVASGWLSNLVGGPAGSRFVVVHAAGQATLRSLIEQPNGSYSSSLLESNKQVTAVAADQGAVYWAEQFAGGYNIMTRRVSVTASGGVSFGGVQTLVHRTGLPSGTRVGHLVVDPSASAPSSHDLWWSVNEVGHPIDPAIVHLVRASGAVVPLVLQGEVSGTHDLATNGSYVYWTDTNAIYRVLSSASPPHAVEDPLSTQDVSPDLPYEAGVSDGNDPGGRISDLVVDQAHPTTLLAASQYAGPWRSTNGGQTWQQSASGMTVGNTVDGATVAIDPGDDQRALYLTDYDAREFYNNSGHVWTSLDNGVSWTAVDGQIPCNKFYAATFADGYAWVSSDCGLYRSADLLTWHAAPVVTDEPPGPSFVIGSGKALFDCGGTSVYRTVTDGASWQRRSLPGVTQCSGNFPLGVIPNGTDSPDEVVAMHLVDGGMAQPARINFTTGTTTGLGFPDIPIDAHKNWTASGVAGVWVAPTASGGYDIFGANGDWYYQWTGGTTWVQFGSTHQDTRSLAFPPSFDPAHGNCRMYVANDGSVDVNPTDPGAGHICAPRSGPFERAQHGLHAYKSSVIAGVHRETCTSPSGAVISPCPVIYIGSGDNDTWVRDRTQSPDWSSFQDCCGDDGGGLIDPALPNRFIITRNGDYQVYQVSGPYVPASARGVEEFPPNGNDVDWPASPSAEWPVYADGEPSLPRGDDVGLRSIPDPTDPHPDNPTTGSDHIVRRMDGGGWTPLGDALPFQSVRQIQTSGGSQHLEIWLRLADGSVRRGVMGAGGISAWNRANPDCATPSAPACNISIIWANPHNRNELWAVDMASHQIMRSSVSPSGTVTWNAVTDLTSFALGYDPRVGTQLWNFGRIENNQIPMQPLTHMWFPSSAASPLRVADLGPGKVAISHDSGATWIPLSGALPWDQWVAYPWSTWLDEGASSGGATSDLYIALNGRGVERVTGPFGTLTDVAYEYCPSGTCPTSAAATRADAAPVAAPSSVGVVDELTGTKITLEQDADGQWRGSQLIDSAGRGQLRYHFVVDGVAQQTVVHTLTAAERRHGQIFAPALSPGTAQTTPRVGPLKVSPALAYSENCDGLVQEVKVAAGIAIPAGGVPDSVHLLVTADRLGDDGDHSTAQLADLTMSTSDQVTWTASFDPVELTNGALAGSAADLNGYSALDLQVRADIKGDSSFGVARELDVTDCLTPSMTVPGALKIISVKTARQGVYVQWSTPKNGGSRIMGYVVTPYRSGVAGKQEFYSRATLRGLVNGLKTGARYTFTVQAINARGTGPRSARSPGVIVQ